MQKQEGTFQKRKRGNTVHIALKSMKSLKKKKMGD